DYWLRQQMRAIQDELGETSPEKSEVQELRRRLAEIDLPDQVRKEAERELGRLERLPAAAPDFQVTRTYLELILELPWKKSADVPRRHARPTGPGPAPGGGEQPGPHARRDRQARPRLPRRPRRRPARDPRPGPEPHVPRQLPRPAVRPVERPVHLHGQRPRPG